MSVFRESRNNFYVYVVLLRTEISRFTKQICLANRCRYYIKVCKYLIKFSYLQSWHNCFFKNTFYLFLLYYKLSSTNSHRSRHSVSQFFFRYCKSRTVGWGCHIQNERKFSATRSVKKPPIYLKSLIIDKLINRQMLIQSAKVAKK